MLFTTTGEREKRGRKSRVSVSSLFYTHSSVLNFQLLTGDWPDCGTLTLGYCLGWLMCNYSWTTSGATTVPETFCSHSGSGWAESVSRPGSNRSALSKTKILVKATHRYVSECEISLDSRSHLANLKTVPEEIGTAAPSPMTAMRRHNCWLM